MVMVASLTADATQEIQPAPYQCLTCALDSPPSLLQSPSLTSPPTYPRVHSPTSLPPPLPLAADQASNLEIRVGNRPIDATTPPGLSQNAICKTGVNPSGTVDMIHVTCNGPVTGRYVSIQRKTSTPGFLTLCEVKVGKQSGVTRGVMW